MTHSNWLTCASSLLWLACGTVQGDEGDASPDAEQSHDAGAGADGAAEPDAASCTLAANVVGPTALSGKFSCGDGSTPCANSDPATAKVVRVTGALNQDTRADVLVLELFAGYGAFADGLITGSFPLDEGDETNYSTCGACVSVWTDVDPDSGNRTETYFQSGGTLTIASYEPSTGGIEPATVSGSIVGLTLAHVTIGDANESTVVGDCTTTVVDFDFTAEVSDAATD